MLKAIVENLDGVDEAFHGEYEEKDGKFVLQLDDTIKAHPSVTPLANALTKLKDEKKTLQTRLTESETKVAPEGFDAAEWQRLRDDDEKRKKDPAYKGPSNEEGLQRQREQYEQRIANMTKKHAEDVAAEKSVTERTRAALANKTAQDDLRAAIAKVGVDGKFTRAVTAMLSPIVKVRRDDETDQVETYVETDMGEQTVEQYMEVWSKGDEGKIYVPAPAGGSAPGNRGGARLEDNPWSAQNWNVTKQGQYVREKGEARAAQAAKAAGTTLGGPTPRQGQQSNTPLGSRVA